jgi:hypothetical protein
VRARFAATIQNQEGSTDARLGDIFLRDHQSEAASRLRHAIDRFGGALLADDVGLGKTYTALAAARHSGSILVVAPAALSGMWESALAHARLSADFISFETLSRREPPRRAYDFVIVDEAHHARNPVTRRYGRLAAITRSARVLLLSATPVHNATADLTTLLSLFLGSRAEHATPAELAACIVRRSRSDVRDSTIPGRAAPVWCDVSGSDDVLRAVLDIPPPCAPRDGGDGGALVSLSLVRAWASTEAALRASLRRRIARAESLGDALASGRHPTRAELKAWVVGDDATQLAFPELVADAITHDARLLLDSVGHHAAGARRALAVLSEGGGAIDDARARVVSDIRRRHEGARVVVFSQSADSARAMFSRLVGDGGVACITANGAWVAGGPLTRAQALSRFAPLATSTPAPSRAEAIDLLIATDLLSEGLNLQDASVVVHLDLPWTAARLTQRLGRVWRSGSPHARVHEYALAPPAPAEELLRVTTVLARKAGAAWAAVGDPFAPLLAERARIAAPAGTVDRARASEDLRRLVASWSDGFVAPARPHRERQPAPNVIDSDEPIAVAGVAAQFEGWLAAVELGDHGQIVACRCNEAPTSDPRSVLALARAAEGAACVTSPSRVGRVLGEVDGYLEAARAARDAGVTAVGSRARNAAVQRISVLAASAPPHRRTAVSRLAAGARTTVAASRSAGAERLLAALVSGADGADLAEAWLERVADAGVNLPPNDDAPATNPTLRALIVLVPQ